MSEVENEKVRKKQNETEGSIGGGDQQRPRG
jgi:hypothetical protein